MPAFLRFFFPRIYEAVDWSRGYESLDKELAQIRPSHRSGKLLADKLFKVYLRDGRETWLLIHIEVQDQAGRAFSKRMFHYNYRLIDKFNAEVISLAVITGSGSKTVGRYETKRFGCHTLFEFPVARIASYSGREAELEASDEIFARVVLAQLKAKETTGDNQKRYEWKRLLLFDLYEHGYKEKEVKELFRFLDFIMTLPEELEGQLEYEVFQYEEGKRMPFVTSFERLAEKRGFQKGLEQGLEQGEAQGKAALIVQILNRQLGALSATMQAQLSRLPLDKLDALGVASFDFKSKADLTAWLKKHAPKNGQKQRRTNRKKA